MQFVFRWPSFFKRDKDTGCKLETPWAFVIKPPRRTRMEKDTSIYEKAKQLGENEEERENFVRVRIDDAFESDMLHRKESYKWLFVFNSWFILANESNLVSSFSNLVRTKNQLYRFRNSFLVYRAVFSRWNFKLLGICLMCFYSHKLHFSLWSDVIPFPF